MVIDHPVCRPVAPRVSPAEQRASGALDNPVTDPSRLWAKGALPTRTPGKLTSMTSTTVRFGILGAARIAPAALIRPAASNPEVTVEVVAARDRGPGRRLRRQAPDPEGRRQLRGDHRRSRHRRRLRPPSQQPPRRVDPGRAGRREARPVREALHLQRRRGGHGGRGRRPGGGRIRPRGARGVPLPLPPAGPPDARDRRIG